MNRKFANRNEKDDLERVLEPLASYICATDRPGAILRSVLSALVHSVAETNRVANEHFRYAAKGGAA